MAVRAQRRFPIRTGSLFPCLFLFKLQQSGRREKGVLVSIFIGFGGEPRISFCLANASRGIHIWFSISISVSTSLTVRCERRNVSMIRQRWKRQGTRSASRTRGTTWTFRPPSTRAVASAGSAKNPSPAKRDCWKTVTTPLERSPPNGR